MVSGWSCSWCLVEFISAVNFECLPSGRRGFLAASPNLLSWIGGRGETIILGERGVHADLREG